jgi:NAD-dependent dihydropyrimidine dehydrogenase PreA subunit
VTDEYGNRVNTRPNISIGAIAGYAVDGSESSDKETYLTKRLYYGTSDINNNRANGNIDARGDSDETTTEFYDSVMTNVFRHVNQNSSDKLIVFGASKQYEAMGKWDFTLKNNRTLTLVDNYFGKNRADLYYAVGHNYYQDQCRSDGREWIGTADSDTYQLDENGIVIVKYDYDHHLAGKDVMIWVNLDGIQPDTGQKTRIGEAVKHTLRTTSLRAVPESGDTVPKETTNKKGETIGVFGHIDYEHCKGCGICVEVCPTNPKSLLMFAEQMPNEEAVRNWPSKDSKGDA